MSKKYTHKQFEKDLQELTNLVNGYNHKGGLKRKKMDKEGEAIRSFKIVELDGKRVKHEGRYHGTKSENNPLTAATHAYKQLCKKHSKSNKSKCRFVFTIKETTRGSKHKEYGPYIGKVEKVPKTTLKLKDPKTGNVKTVTREYKYHVKLHDSK